jgi:hypothetical protein
MENLNAPASMTGPGELVAGEHGEDGTDGF